MRLLQLYLPLLFACSEDQDYSDFASENANLCSESWHIPADEIPEGWNASANMIVEQLNENRYCVWEKDGSLTKLRFRIIPPQGHGFEDYVRVSPRPQFSTYQEDCRLRLSFWTEIVAFSETGEQLIQYSSQEYLNEYSYDSQFIPYHNTETPLPPSSTDEEVRFALQISGYGNFPEGEVNSLTINTWKNGVLPDDTAHCYPEWPD